MTIQFGKPYVHLPSNTLWIPLAENASGGVFLRDGKGNTMIASRLEFENDFKLYEGEEHGNKH
jgi:hypothetical protein